MDPSFNLNQPMGEPMADAMAEPTGEPMAEGADLLDIATMLDAQAADLEPAYPAWLYKTQSDGTRKLSPPSKPSVGQFESWAQSDWMLHGLLVLRFLSDLNFYRQRDAGVFEDFDRKTDEAFFSPEPTTQINKLCAMLGGLNVRVSWPFKTEPQKKDAQAAEDWGYWLLEKWKATHQGMGNGPLQWEMGFSAGIYGRVIVRVLPDPDDPECPFKLDLMDPSICFPIYGDKWGLLRMSLVYKKTLGEIIDGFDPAGSRGLFKKLQKHYLTKTKADETTFDLDRDAEVREVWTRWSRFVSVDGVKILHENHEYGRVPFYVRIMPGEMGMASTPDATNLPVQVDERDFFRDGTVAGVSTRQMDIARKGLSFFHGFRTVVRYEEMLYGLLMTIMKLDANPPQITESPYQDDPTPVDLRPGGHTKRRPNEKTTPVQTAARIQVLNPLASLIRAAQQRAGFPDNVFGIVDGSNVTGFAENTLLAATKDRIQPYIDALADVYQGVLELAAYLYHGFGHLYVDDAITGALSVPGRKRNPLGFGAKASSPMPPMASMALGGANPTDMASSVMGQGPMPGAMGMIGQAGEAQDADGDELVEITRDTFATIGFLPKVALESFDWNKMTQVANVAGMLIDKGIWSQWTAMDKVGVEDPDLENRMIIVEKAKQNPALFESVIIPQALWQAGDKNAFLAYMMIAHPELLGMAPPPQPGMPGGMGGLNDLSGMGAGAQGSVPGIQSVQGDSQPMLGPDGVPGAPRNNGPDMGAQPPAMGIGG